MCEVYSKNDLVELNEREKLAWQEIREIKNQKIT